MQETPIRNQYMTTISSLIEQRDTGKISREEFHEKFSNVLELRELEEIREMRDQQKKQRLQSLIENSELGRRFKDRTFSSFEVDEHNKSLYKKCLEYAENFKEHNGKGLLFIGSVGTGKTHLAAAITNYIIHTHYLPVKFGSVNTLLGEIKNTYDNESKETESQVIKKLSEVELLVIDDLGKEKTTEWSNSIIYTIINSRYEGYKPVIVTTNLSVNQLENTVGEATVSRLIEMCEGVKMDGADYRKSKLIK